MRYNKFLKLIHFIGDISLINIAFIGAFFIINRIHPNRNFNDTFIFLLILFNLVWVLIIFINKIYEIGRVEKLESILWNLFKSLALHSLIIFSIIAAIQGYYYSRGHLLLTYAILGCGLLIWRLSFLYALKKYRQKGSNFRNIVILGAGSSGIDIYNYFQTETAHGYKFLGFFDDNPEKCLHKNKVLGTLKDLPTYAQNVSIDEIYCALPLTSSEVIKELVTFADNNLIRFKVVPDLGWFFNKRADLVFYDMVPVLTIRREPLENILNRILKRGFDIVFSFLVITLIFPWLFPALILLIKASSPGPAFFIQKRSGRKNEIFYCYKFRSMRLNNDADMKQAVKGDVRITMIGRFLRKSNLDELPQFFNVLIGNMSVVGPRPHMLKHTTEYSLIIDKFMVRHLVKPGITGWAQVNGLRGQTDDQIKMVKRVRYDLWYVENWSFVLDLKIIILTVYNMVRGEKNAS